MRPAPGSGLWLQGLLCGAVLTFAAPLALLGGLLLLPGLICAALETAPGRPVTCSVALMGTAFALPPLWRLLLAGYGWTAAVDLMTDPWTVGPAWLAGAFGWAICEVLPMALAAFFKLRAATRLAALGAEEKSLREAWDLPDGA